MNINIQMLASETEHPRLIEAPPEHLLVTLDEDNALSRVRALRKVGISARVVSRTLMAHHVRLTVYAVAFNGFNGGVR